MYVFAYAYIYIYIYMCVCVGPICIYHRNKYQRHDITKGIQTKLTSISFFLSLFNYLILKTQTNTES